MTPSLVTLESLLQAAFGGRFDDEARAAVVAELRAHDERVRLAGDAGAEIEDGVAHRRPMVFDISGLIDEDKT